MDTLRPELFGDFCVLLSIEEKLQFVSESGFTTSVQANKRHCKVKQAVHAVKQCLTHMVKQSLGSRKLPNSLEVFWKLQIKIRMLTQSAKEQLLNHPGNCMLV